MSMVNVIRRITSIGACAFVFLFGASVHAISTDVFLDASSVTASDSKSLVQVEAEVSGTSSVSGGDNMSQTAYATSVSEGNVNEDVSLWERIRAYFAVDASSSIATSTRPFWRDLLAGIGIRISAAASSSVSQGEAVPLYLTNVHVTEVGAMSATVTWSPETLTRVKVYYATSSPIIITEAGVRQASSKLWNRNQVTLRGLSPDTTYFYKVVAETKTGTSTSAEASFRTIVR